MKFLSRSSLRALLFVVTVAVLAGAQGTRQRKKSTPSEPPAQVLKVRVLVNQDTPALEITADRPVAPVVNKLDNPPRLQIELPNTLMSVDSKTIEVNNPKLTTVHLEQIKKKPPTIHIVMDLRNPVEYASNTVGNQLVIRLGTSSSGIPSQSTVAANTNVPSVSGFTTGVRPIAVPVAPGGSGALILAGDRLANGSAVTAGADTTILRLSRGGEVHVCPGTTVSVTAAEKGDDLMLGMSIGALETHYHSAASSDSVLTPDFRILLAGPGDFDFAISADSRGNTCVRSLPGNTNPVTVAELMGTGTYVVKPDEQVMFRSGRLSSKDNNIPLSCGCPPPAAPVLRASNDSVMPEKNLPQSFHLAQPGDETKTVAPPANTSGLPTSGAPPSQVAMSVVAPPNAKIPSNAAQVQVDVDAPLVFRASDAPPPRPAAPASPDTGHLPITYARSPQPPPQATVLPPPTKPQAAPQQKEKRGFFGGIKGFFSKVFH